MRDLEIEWELKRIYTIKINYFFQKSGVKITNKVNISSLPTIMLKDKIHLFISDISA